MLIKNEQEESLEAFVKEARSPRGWQRQKSVLVLHKDSRKDSLLYSSNFTSYWRITKFLDLKTVSSKDSRVGELSLFLLLCYSGVTGLPTSLLLLELQLFTASANHVWDQEGERCEIHQPGPGVSAVTPGVLKGSLLSALQAPESPVMLQRGGHSLYPHTPLISRPQASHCHITHWNVSFPWGNV